MDHPEYDDHELALFWRDPAGAGAGIIAIHDSSAGPALGGCRMAGFASAGDALTDVLRLSRGMTYKNVMAGLPHGGGKAVLLGDPRRDKSDALLLAFGREVERLGGRYITAEDVGIGVADIEIVHRVTGYVRGLPEGGPGDPSPMTAFGVFCGIRAALAHRALDSDPGRVRVAVQGLGAVGMRLCELLDDFGARLAVADIDPARVADAVNRFGAEAVESGRCHSVQADVYAPCALGATLNTRTIPELRCTTVAGAANNQLPRPEDGTLLFERGILYAPDYVINAGGVISIAHEGPAFDAARMQDQVARIGDTLTATFRRAEAEGRPTSVVADRIALERIEALRAAR